MQKTTNSLYYEIGEKPVYLEHEPKMSSEKSKELQSKGAEILRLVKEGCKRSELVIKFPTMIRQIRDAMEFRPPRSFKTHCIYVHGPTGVGKTTAIQAALNYCADNHGVLTYHKLSGFNKFWDGYDNQEVVSIDDPTPFTNNGRLDEQAYGQFLGIVSNCNPIRIEVKGSSMQFDSKLVIISTNISPDRLVSDLPQNHKMAMYRRMKMHCYRHCDRKMTERLYKLITKKIMFLVKNIVVENLPILYFDPTQTLEKDFTM